MHQIRSLAITSHLTDFFFSYVKWLSGLLCLVSFCCEHECVQIFPWRLLLISDMMSHLHRRRLLISLAQLHAGLRWCYDRNILAVACCGSQPEPRSETVIHFSCVQRAGMQDRQAVTTSPHLDLANHADPASLTAHNGLEACKTTLKIKIWGIAEECVK